MWTRGFPFCTVVTLLLGCIGRSALDPIEIGQDAGAGGMDAGTLITHSDKVDILLVIDNSKNLETAHTLFADTLPYLFDRLAHPACVNGLGNVVATTPNPTDPCPVGKRDFDPVTDFRVAAISTSLGGHGADICAPGSPSFNPTMNDAAHLLSRNNSGGTVPTYAGRGFLSWDPTQTQSPPGDNDIDALSSKLGEIVQGIGRNGCGFESQLESIYRFLVDPNPYQSVQVQNGTAVLEGTDELLLQQRADFVRPDSAVVVILLTDENDCSTREGGQFFISNQQLNSDSTLFHLPRSRSECAIDPNHTCCKSCGQSPGSGCPPNESDPNCASPLTDIDDPINLRCFDQKRRFGIDFLYPVDRYIKGLTDSTVADREGNVVPNPLFVGGRSPDLILFAGIVGVPWQDVAIDPTSIATGYRKTSEIDWSLVIGDPATFTPPADPLMIESIDPRQGSNPVLGVELASPSSTDPMANPINGHERVIPQRNDLQYACIFSRPIPKDCTIEIEDCHCTPPDQETDPLCQKNDGTYASIERKARALPGIRQLHVLSGLGDRGIAASICAPVVSGAFQPTFGYKPAMDAVLRSLRGRIGMRDEG